MKLSKHKLGELIEVTRGASLSGQFYAEKGELIRLTLGNFNMNGGGFKENTSKTNLYYTGTVKDEFILNKGDIITPLTEQSLGLLGTTARIPESGKYIQSQDVALVKCKEGLLDPNFCYYLISSSVVRQQLSAGAQQTKIRHTSPDKIKDCTAWVPELEVQKRIGRILYDIDEEIALNRQINDNLEAMAKQLYDYWFVQFDFPNEECKPYKSSGGTMVWNEKLKREIPQGWIDCNLKDFINLFDSKRVPLSSKDRGERHGIYPYYGATGIMDYVNDYIFDGDYILLAEDGSTSDGKGFPIVQYIWGKNWVNNHAHIILPKNEQYTMFTYQMLRSIPAKQIETGSIQKKISQENLCGYKIALPYSDLMERYENIVSPLWEKRKCCFEEINALTKQREELLPLLMNGQATVNYHLSVLFITKIMLYYKETNINFRYERNNNTKRFRWNEIGFDR